MNACVLLWGGVTLQVIGNFIKSDAFLAAGCVLIFMSIAVDRAGK